MTRKSGSSFGRRGFMLGTAAIASAAALGVPFESVRAATVLDQAAPDLASYTPGFFTDAEFRLLCAITDRLIPGDGDGEKIGPGALEANVPVFLDMQIGGDYGQDWYLKGPFPKRPSPLMGYQMPYLPSEVYQRGLKLFADAAQAAHGKAFEDLSADEQDAFLSDVQSDKVDFLAMGEDYLSGSNFFGQLWSDTKNGYLSDPMYGGNKGMGAWIMIGYPGARASFREWVTQHNVPYPLGPVSVQGMRA
ncbi:gluconate 2-dehydrogenase subunit 3 family protein [Pseudooceanicola sp. CBS1P-1]|uniref:Gluconate 2-dehydrogenase subunit 3 family protein n=1 Tax=Pseudooceanicola albus TaxID=2692189 RepID=A0A6L7G7B5_9RHOB|nr:MULTISPECIES: gluconate 2-dehydrogenase subunit 3 family protein [Pseudooceanicola]MBT9386095.1 gluconate 2-dehydrogenase subunit 3 family protein [Pseudooceanicola endophyticus]MXN19487.1 gluconate 2-dehydrogenase subunit 3 family protein [Pseudooceanicola albus]